MKISVLGLGYVGTVSAACLARDGHEVTGIDPQPRKVELVASGRTPVIEAHVGEILALQAAAGRIRATTDVASGLAHAELILVCVGTPGLPNGGLDVRYIRRVAEQIGLALRTHPGAPVVAVRSTLLPGTMRKLFIPTLAEFSGRRAGVDFGVCLYPEFLREGSAVADYDHPPKVVVGELNRASGDLVAGLRADDGTPLLRTDIETAEMVKYADNAWHALKVGFANEMGCACRAFGIDAERLMELFLRDTRLNVSSAYLRPGFAFGGSCLPKDLRALVHRAHMRDLSLPILEAILPSNARHVERGVQAVLAAGRGRVGILGLAFKPGTDDLRESPVVELAERLLGKGCDLRLYDRNVALAGIHGANRDFILHRIPHISRLLVQSVDAVLAHAEVLVLGHSTPEFREAASRLAGDRVVVDLARLGTASVPAAALEGIAR